MERSRHRGKAPGPLERELQTRSGSALRTAGARLAGIARQAFKATRIKHRTDRYIRKVFPDLDERTLQARVDLMAKTVGISQAPVVHRLSANIFELTSPN